MTAEEKRETEILAVSVDSKADLQRMVDRISREDGRVPDYIFLSDPGHRVIDRYGLLNPDDPRGIPHPTTYVIDKQGIVRWKFTEVDYKIRPTNQMILEALRSIR
ncbi:hypothetical protein HRbin33_02622 [bacterium HR33]|nr:hypothetical protein HRbin33_02622 [bacterium HR33]